MYRNPYEDLSEEIKNKGIKEAGFVEKQFDTGEIRLNYVEGPKHGCPLVLIPAQMGTWESYHKVLASLSKHFKVYAIDVRGHGKSSWMPGDYSWSSVGRDMQSFLKEVVKEKAIVAGTSSGGIIALWCAANLPDCVRGVVLEDAPVFSVEMPRFKEEDRFVYDGLKNLVDKIGDPCDRDLANYFKDTVMPISEKRQKQVPDWFIDKLSKKIRQYEKKYPKKPIEVGFPSSLRLLIKSLSMFDPDFARAFVDGRFYEGMDHEDALKRVACPMLVLHANWKRLKHYGLVGAMDDNDAERIMKLVKKAQYKKIPANHVIHAFKPKAYVESLKEFWQSI